MFRKIRKESTYSLESILSLGHWFWNEYLKIRFYQADSPMMGLCSAQGVNRAQESERCYGRIISTKLVSWTVDLSNICTYSGPLHEFFNDIDLFTDSFFKFMLMYAKSFKTNNVMSLSTIQIFNNYLPMMFIWKSASAGAVQKSRTSTQKVSRSIPGSAITSLFKVTE